METLTARALTAQLADEAVRCQFLFLMLYSKEDALLLISISNFPLCKKKLAEKSRLPWREAVWRCGGVAVWRPGGVAVWRCGVVAQK